MLLRADAVLSAPGAAQGTQCGAVKERRMGLRWGAAYDSAGARYAAAQWGAVRGRAEA